MLHRHFSKSFAQIKYLFTARICRGGHAKKREENPEILTTYWNLKIISTVLKGGISPNLEPVLVILSVIY